MYDHFDLRIIPCLCLVCTPTNPSAFWDLFMDFSLLQAGSRHFLLRDIVALKRRWVYYAVMIVDPVLRFSWIFYAIFTHDTQHNTVCSFMVAFGEATRRGIWALLRVENEHSSNVAHYKASRDIPLPYDLHEAESLEQTEALLGGESEPDAGTEGGDGASVGRTAAIAGTPSTRGRTGTVDGSPGEGTPGRVTPSGSIRSDKASHKTKPGTADSRAGTWPHVDDSGAASAAEEGTAGATATGAAPGGSDSPGLYPNIGTIRRRFTTTLGKSIGTIMAEAHKQDFEKKRKPGTDESAIGQPGAVDDLPSSDEEDNGDEEAIEADDGDSGDDDEMDEQGLPENGGNSGGYRNSPSGGGREGGGGPARSHRDSGGSGLRRTSSRPY